ncbi:MAG: DUF6220 domain-containing protein [Actinomycetota bacterium]
MRAARMAFLWLQRAFLLGLLVQVLFIGFGVFPRKDDPSPFALHRSWGYLLGYIAAALFVTSLLARPGRRTVLITLVVFLLTFLAQPLLAQARESAPIVAALHPVDALLIFWLTLILGRRAAALTTTQEGAA